MAVGSDSASSFLLLYFEIESPNTKDSPDICSYSYLSSSPCSNAAVGTSNVLRPRANQSTIAMRRNPINIGGA